MSLRVYNTLSQTKEPFETVEPGKVGMYVCGPTVYSESHIGHMVGPVIFDTIKRYLVYLGYEATWVVNITDVDDKLIVQAQKDGTTVGELAERVTRDYLDCLAALGVDGIDHMPRTTEHIGEIIAINQALIDKGFAYESGGDVYFDVGKAAEYGKLSHRDPEDLLAGARIEPSALKHHSGDFALWKRSKPGEPSWPSPWGPGRPGLAYRMLGDEHEISGKPFRHPRRRPRPGLPAPRKRAGPVGVLFGSAVCLVLDAQWPLDQAGQEDLQVRPGHDRAHERPAQGSFARHAAAPCCYPATIAGRSISGPTGSTRSTADCRRFIGPSSGFTELTGERFDQLNAPVRRGRIRSRATRHCCEKSPNIASSFWPRWTMTSIPAGPSVSCSRSCMP